MGTGVASHDKVVLALTVPTDVPSGAVQRATELVNARERDDKNLEAEAC
jgi:hypothetical protein